MIVNSTEVVADVEHCEFAQTAFQLEKPIIDTLLGNVAQNIIEVMGGVEDEFDLLSDGGVVVEVGFVSVPYIASEGIMVGLDGVHIQIESQSNVGLNKVTQTISLESNFKPA